MQSPKPKWRNQKKNCNIMMGRGLHIVGLLLAMSLYSDCIPPGPGGHQQCISERTHRPCIFPFKYTGAMYYKCTKAGRSRQHWCATSINSRNQKVTRMEDCNLDTCDFDGNIGSRILVGAPAYGCKEDNIEYVGGDFGQVTRQLSWENCKIACRDTSRCTHWTFRRADGSCFLKTSNRMRTYAQGLISGPKNCNVRSGQIHPVSRCSSNQDCPPGHKCQLLKCVDQTSSDYSCNSFNKCYAGAACQYGKCVSMSSPNYDCSDIMDRPCPAGTTCRWGKCEGSIYG